jgi:hypothetical protein
VFYIACEGRAGIRERIKALKQRFSELDDDLPFHLIKVTPNLGQQPGDLGKILEIVRRELDGDERR